METASQRVLQATPSILEPVSNVTPIAENAPMSVITVHPASKATCWRTGTAGTAAHPILSATPKLNNARAVQQALAMADAPSAMAWQSISACNVTPPTICSTMFVFLTAPMAIFLPLHSFANVNLVIADVWLVVRVHKCVQNVHGDTIWLLAVAFLRAQPNTMLILIHETIHVCPVKVLAVNVIRSRAVLLVLLAFI